MLDLKQPKGRAALLELVRDADVVVHNMRPNSAEKLVSRFDVPATQVAHAVLLGQMTTGFPVSPLTPATYPLTGLARIDLGDHRRFTIPWLFAVTCVMTLACTLLGVFPI